MIPVQPLSQCGIPPCEGDLTQKRFVKVIKTPGKKLKDLVLTTADKKALQQKQTFENLNLKGEQLKTQLCGHHAPQPPGCTWFILESY
jgi:hypothetical protein